MADLKLSLQLNCAMASLKLDTEAGNKAAIAACDAALAIEPKSVKGLFRRAQALEKLKDYQGAKKSLAAAAELDAADTAIKRLGERVDALILRQEKKEKAMYGKMFS